MPRDLFTIKKIFGPTIQGEGALTGTLCHFIRFAGCNMWDGRPQTRARSLCPYCDTDFYGGEKMSIYQIIDKLKALGDVKWVVLSGGEPMLQVTEDLVRDLQFHGYQVMIETNGSIPIDFFIDHVTVSPKIARGEIKVQWVHSLKLLYPHPFLKPEDFEDFACHEKFLQPIEDENWKKNITNTLEYVRKSGGKWRLSLQTHKMIGAE